MSKSKKIEKFSGFSFTMDNIKCKDEIAKVKDNFSYSNLITICNRLRNKNVGNFDELNAKIIWYLYDLSLRRDNITNKNDYENDSIEINKNSLLNKPPKQCNNDDNHEKGINNRQSNNNYSNICFEVSDIHILVVYTTIQATSSSEDNL